ncbi:response regulator transcription factor [Puteibacter caeruleilacunae]|nr:response regulator transcription factor [Puteibacter caeruleilacunae]
MKRTILLIEDDKNLQKAISSYLINSGYECDCTDSLIKGRALFEKYNYPIVLLDLNLPDGDGLEYIPYIKSLWEETGVLIISARDKLEDRIDGLNLGADDFLVKPFHLSELNARIQALLRRYNIGKKDIIQFNEIELDNTSQTVTINGELVSFSRKEYDLLLYFLINKGRVLTKESLFEHVWGENSVLMNNSDFIYTHMNRLRKKVKKHTGKDYIKTVYGFGYKLDYTN